MRHQRWLTACALGLWLALAGSVESQERRNPRGFLGLAFVVGDPVGNLGLFFDDGFGGQLTGALPFADDGRLRLRADLGFLVYGHERLEFCHPVSCRVGVDLTTTNTIFHAGVGPEYALATGVFEPYVYATTGLSYFATISSLSGDGDRDDFAETTNYDDVVMAWKIGGGMRLRVIDGHRPVSLDFGVERHQNGIANFLTEGDIVDNPDGTVTLFPNRSEANLVMFRFGVTIGLGGGDG